MKLQKFSIDHNSITTDNSFGEWYRVEDVDKKIELFKQALMEKNFPEAAIILDEEL